MLTKSKTRKAKFISIESIGSGPNAKLEAHVVESLKPISKTKSKGRFRIEGPIEGVLQSVLQNEDYLSSLMSSCVDLSDAIGTPTKGGILMYNQKTMAVLQINGQWFEVTKSKVLETIF